MIASLTFPEVLVQQVSLFISSPFFLCDCLGLPTSQLRTHRCHEKNHPGAAKWERIPQAGATLAQSGAAWTFPVPHKERTPCLS